MVGGLEEVKSAMGGIMPDTSSLASYVGIILTVILICIFLTVGVIWFINFVKYNKKVRLFRKVGNKIVPTLFDKAQFARLGASGDYWCVMKKFKKTLPKPRIQMSKDEFWFYEREDGEWINFGLGDFDAQMRNTGAYYVDEDMRLQRLGIQKNLEERFKKVTFWERYGGMIISIVYVLVVTICFVVLFKQMKDAWTGATEMAGAVKEMALELRNIRGSGITPVVGMIIPFGLMRRKK